MNRKCCGASTARLVDSTWARNLVVNTLASATDEAADILMPCPSCYANHLKVVMEIQKGDASGEFSSLNQAPRLKHLMEVLDQDLGQWAIQKHVVRHLTGLRVLPYYGCLVGRAFPLGGESRENPRALERIIEATGAQPLDFPGRLDCCGGPILFSRDTVAFRLTGKLLEDSVLLAADCVVVVCPLCHLMLDAKQRIVERETGKRYRIPVLYITQLLGLAFGLNPKKLGMHRLITPAYKFLSTLSGSSRLCGSMSPGQD